MLIKISLKIPSQKHRTPGVKSQYLFQHKRCTEEGIFPALSLPKSQVAQHGERYQLLGKKSTEIGGVLQYLAHQVKPRILMALPWCQTGTHAPCKIDSVPACNIAGALQQP
jgi:hypothetical protein